VVLGAVNLDYDSLAAPEEVDLVVLVAKEQVAVDLGRWQPGLLAEVAKAALKAACRDVLAEVAAYKDGPKVANARVAVRADE
jgi:hypothetical protein